MEGSLVCRDVLISSIIAKIKLPDRKQLRPSYLLIACLLPGNTLTTVDEESDLPGQVSYPDLQEQDGIDDADDGIVDDASSLQDSQESSSQTMFEELDQDDMINAFDDLYHSALTVLDALEAGNGEQAKKILSDLQLPKSVLSKTLKRSLSKLETDKSPFDADELFIDVPIATRAMLSKCDAADIGKGSYRPDAVLQIANLAYLTAQLASSKIGDPNTGKLLESLSLHFPGQVLAEFPRNAKDLYGSIELLKLTVSTAMRLRALYFIHKAMISSQSSSNALSSDDLGIRLLEIFNNSEGQPRGFDPVHKSSPIPRQFETQWKSIVHKISTTISKADLRNPVDMQKLLETVPWESTISAVIMWATQLHSVLDKQVGDAGGVEAIQEDLQTENLRRQGGANIPTLVAKKSDVPQKEKQDTSAKGDLVLSDALRDSTNKEGKSFKPSIGMAQEKQGRAKMKAIAAAKKAGKAKQQAEEQSQPPTEVDARTNQVADDTANHIVEVEIEDVMLTALDGDAEDLPTSYQQPPATQPILTDQEIRQLARAATRNKSPAADSNKENRPSPKRGMFVDRQKTATRIGFDDDSQNRPRHSKPSSAKRRREAVENDSEDDDAFETAPQSHSPSRRREKMAALPSSKRARTDAVPRTGDPEYIEEVDRPNSVIANNDDAGEDEEGGGEEDDDDEEEDGEGDSPNAPNTQLQDETRRWNEQRASSAARQPLHSISPPPSTTAERHAIINRQAKAAVASRPYALNRVQVRRAWTADEIDRLVDLLSKTNSWKAIKDLDQQHEDGGVLEGRDQVALKDKARNLKIDYIK